jgi:MEKHLA domain
MSPFPRPSAENLYLVEHLELLRSSFRHYTGKDLVSADLSPTEAAKNIFYAPFILVSHDRAKDPIFNYGNQAALNLFEMTWEELTDLPSRKSAEAPDREERARLLAQVSRCGFIANYSGVRISQSGKRFQIDRATVWNLIDSNRNYCGQAALFSDWKYLSVE